MPISRKASVTAGLMCAPLNFPTGDSAMQAPVVPKRKPVISRRSPSLGISRAIGVPVPNIRMTSDRPISTSRAVPAHSEANTRQGKRQPFRSFSIRASFS